MRTLRFATIAVGAALALAAPAQAADWQDRGPITPSDQGVTDLEGGVDAAGNSLFVWSAGAPGDSELFYSARPRAGSFGLVTRMRGATAALVDTALAPNGDAVAAWPERERPNTTNVPLLRAAVREAGRGFGRPQTIFDAGTGSICWTRTAIGANGEAILLFGFSPAEPTDIGCQPHAAVRAPGADEFGDPVRIADDAANRPAAEVDAQGNALIAWRGPLTRTVRVSRHPAGGGFTAPQDVAVRGETVPELEGPVVLRVSAATGRAILGFPSGRRTHVAAAIGSTRAGFPANANVLSGPADLGSAQIGAYFDGAAGANGTLALTWRSSGRGRTRTQVAYVGPRASRITAARTRSVSGYGIQVPRLTVTPQGRVTAVWVRLVRRNVRALEATTAAPGRGFAKPERIRRTRVASRPNPAIETNTRGDQWVVWNRTAQVGVAGFAVESARASARSGRFGRIITIARGSGRGNTVDATQLYRGANGAMLAAIRRSRETPQTLGWELYTNGER